MKKAMVVLAVLMLGGCFRSEEEKIRHEFVDGCTTAGVTESVCSCSYDKLLEKYPSKFMVAIKNQGIAPDGFVDDIVQAQLLCTAGSTKSLLVDASPVGGMSPAPEFSHAEPQPATAQDGNEGASGEGGAASALPGESLEEIKNRYETTDGILNIAYRRTMERLEEDKKPGLKERQRAWVVERDKKCGSTDGTTNDVAGYVCLIEATQERTEILENLH